MILGVFQFIRNFDPLKLILSGTAPRVQRDLDAPPKSDPFQGRPKNDPLKFSWEQDNTPALSLDAEPEISSGRKHYDAKAHSFMEADGKPVKQQQSRTHSANENITSLEDAIMNNRRAGNDRRGEREAKGRRHGLDRRTRSKAILFKERRKTYNRRAARDRRCGIDRRLIYNSQRIIDFQHQNDMTSTPIYDADGNLMAYTVTQGGNLSIKTNINGEFQHISMQLDDKTGDITLIGQRKEVGAINTSGSAKGTSVPMTIQSSGETTIHLRKRKRLEPRVDSSFYDNWNS